MQNTLCHSEEYIFKTTKRKINNYAVGKKKIFTRYNQEIV